MVNSVEGGDQGPEVTDPCSGLGGRGGEALRRGDGRSRNGPGAPGGSPEVPLTGRLGWWPGWGSPDTGAGEGSWEERQEKQVADTRAGGGQGPGRPTVQRRVPGESGDRAGGRRL